MSLYKSEVGEGDFFTQIMRSLFNNKPVKIHGYSRITRPAGIKETPGASYRNLNFTVDGAKSNRFSCPVTYSVATLSMSFHSGCKSTNSPSVALNSLATDGGIANKPILFGNLRLLANAKNTDEVLKHLPRILAPFGGKTAKFCTPAWEKGKKTGKFIPRLQVTKNGNLRFTPNFKVPPKLRSVVWHKGKASEPGNGRALVSINYKENGSPHHLTDF